MTEKQCGQLVKCLTFDNGGEYVIQQFEEYILQLGIAWQRFVPHTTQKNGVVEQKNRILVEMARCLLQAKDLLTKFWAEAIYYAITS